GLGKNDRVTQSTIFVIDHLSAEHGCVAEQTIKRFVNKNVGIEINSSHAKQPFQPDDIGAMRKVRYRVPKNLAGRLDSLHVYNFTRDLPPRPGRLMFAVKENFARLDTLYSAFQAGVMYQTPRFATAVRRHAKTIV